MGEPPNELPGLIIRSGDTVHELSGTDSGERFTFGRSESCSVCLDPDDVGISRRAGSIEADGGVWWLINRSTSRQFSVIDELGLRSVLPPGRRHAIEGWVRVVVDGSQGSHELEIGAPTRETTSEVVAPGKATAMGDGVLVSHDDRLALVALFAGYLAYGPRYDPHPKTYDAAAARLGWPRTTLVKRIEYLRTRLHKAGVPSMTGQYALANLAEYVLAAGIITRDDLRLIYPDR